MPYTKVKLSHISLKALELGQTYQYPIYYNDKDNLYKVLINKGSKYSQDIEKIIIDKSIKDVYVKNEDHKQYEIDTQNYFKKIINDDNVSTDLKAQIVHEMTVDTINELFTGEPNTNKIERSYDLVNDTIQLILNNDDAVKAMLKVTSYDYYTYTHSVNVSIYTLGFGAYLKLSKEKLELLGMAGMLHDLGKRNIPNDIVNKNGKLTDEEFEIMKNHPTHTVHILKHLGQTDDVLLKSVEQHHEKIDGSGYPYGLKGDEINIFAQIISIVDIFDALTTKRSYKDAMPSIKAFDIMYHQMKGELNPILLQKFIKFMSVKQQDL
ncbi:MAG: HD-GYP domain-containing protein [Campylobacterota bacterium]|nr:HD-GYP domain-containing protein [Campylobacterota bacterium]